jgi:hypothetical protein
MLLELLYITRLLFVALCLGLTCVGTGYLKATLKYRSLNATTKYGNQIDFQEAGQESVDTPEYYAEEQLKLEGGIYQLKPSKMQWAFNG